MLTLIICPIFSEKISPSRHIASNELEVERLSFNMVCFIMPSSFRNLIYNNVCYEIFQVYEKKGIVIVTISGNY